MERIQKLVLELGKKHLLDQLVSQAPAPTMREKNVLVIRKRDGA
jgi:hypothetical protein